MQLLPAAAAAPLLPRQKSWVDDVSKRLRMPSFSFQRGGSNDLELEIEEPSVRWWRIFPTMMFQFAALTMLLPALPNLKLQFFQGDIKKAAFMQSFMQSARAVLTTCVSGEVGRLSDTVGRKPFILLSVVCTLMPFLTLLVTTNLYPYFLFFILAGALGSQESPASRAFVADCVPPDKRANYFGFLSGALGLTMMAAPMIGGALSTLCGHSILFRVVVIVESVALIAASRLPESLPKDRRKPFQCQGPLKGYTQSFNFLRQQSNSLLRGFLSVILFSSLASSLTGPVMMFTLLRKLALSDFEMGAMSAGISLSSIIGTVVVLPLLLKKGVTEMGILVFANVFGVISSSFIVLIVHRPSKILLVVFILIGTVSSCGGPAFTSLLTKASHEDYGMVLGVVTAIEGLTTFLGPLLSSALFAIQTVIPFAVSMVLNFLAVGILTYMWWSDAASRIDCPTS